MNKLFACLVSALLFLTITIPVFAAKNFDFPKPTNGEVMEALQATVPVRFLPGNPLYFFILIKESVSRFFQPSAVERSKFDFAVSGKRLKESYLLLKRGDGKRASFNLSRYAKRNENVISQIEKSRAQNQAVEPTVSAMADALRFQERLLFTIYAMRPESDPAFEENFSQAVDSFKDLVLEIDKIKLGVKNRFEITKTIEASSGADMIAEPTPEPTPPEATTTYKPRRIIY